MDIMPKRLAQIAEWMESTEPPSPNEAQALFESVIPATLDLEVASLYDQSRDLLRRALELAGNPEEVVKEKMEEAALTELPPSCADCDDAKPTYSYGDYKLVCLHSEEPPKQPPLAVVEREEAFYQPADVSHEQLKLMAKRSPPPTWCPRRHR